MRLIHKENPQKLYIVKIRKQMESPDQSALLIMGRFRGQMSAVQSDLDENTILRLVVTISAGTTDKLQPLDVTVNKAAFSMIVSTSGMPRESWNSLRTKGTLNLVMSILT